MVLHRVANPAWFSRACVRSSRTSSASFFAGLAQLVEQLICNQWVAGSSPAAGTSFALLTQW